MPVGKETGPLKYFAVTFHYTEHTTAQGVVMALNEDDAKRKVFENVGAQVTNLMISSIGEVTLDSDLPVDMDDLPEGVVKLNS
jgi:hypothetical protein